jgi:hypothetical protein
MTAAIAGQAHDLPGDVTFKKWSVINVPVGIDINIVKV